MKLNFWRARWFTSRAQSPPRTPSFTSPSHSCLNDDASENSSIASSAYITPPRWNTNGSYIPVNVRIPDVHDSDDFTTRRDQHISQSHFITTLSDTFAEARCQFLRHQNKFIKMYRKLSSLQRKLLILLVLLVFTLTILFLVYKDHILALLMTWAYQWSNIRAGWLLITLGIIITSFPPLIGYSTIVTLSGFIYGVPLGWFIAAPSTVIGSFLSFMVSRFILRGFASRLASDSRFSAVAIAIEHDGLKLLVLIRLCPLPFSLSNAALATVYNVEWYTFVLATLLSTPKLLLHVFIGRELAELAREKKDMSMKARLLSSMGILIGVSAGLIVGMTIFRKARLRSMHLESSQRLISTNEFGDAWDDYTRGRAFPDDNESTLNNHGFRST